MEANLDENIREVAKVEPSLQFPACIGLIKLYNGKITNLTAEEIEAWNQAKRELGEDFRRIRALKFNGCGTCHPTQR